jgi:MFS family permease
MGSRTVIGLGILLSAATLWGFATAEATWTLVMWRILSGVAVAAIYVPLTGGIARWFPDRERGLSQGTLGGIGGALGEGSAYVLLPVLSIYFAAGWRQGMNLVGIGIAVIGVICLLLLRSAPTPELARARNAFDWSLLGNAHLWCFAFLWSGFVIGIRIAQIWIAVYAAEVYISAHGMPLNQAVVAGGLIALLAYSLVGRAVGNPVAGKMSDALVKRGFSRTAILIAWLLFGAALFQILASGVTSIPVIVVLAMLLGMSVNLFALIPAAISDSFGFQRTASLSSFANTLAQLSGATALAVSGYIGITLNAQPGNAIAEYRGIWLSAVFGMTLMAILAGGAYVALQRGWVNRTAPLSPATT